MAPARTASRAASQAVPGLCGDGRTQSASSAISTAVAVNPVSGLWAKPTSSYQKAPASSATRAAVSSKCRRAKKYIPAGMSNEIAQNTSLTPPTYQTGWPRPAASNSFRTPAIRAGVSHERAP